MNRLSLYNEFIFFRNNQGEYTYVDCSKLPHIYWSTNYNWQVKNVDEQIVVFVFQYKILGDVGYNIVAFTEKNNYKNRFNASFDFSKVCKLVHLNLHSFPEVVSYLVSSFGYKRENIFEEFGNFNRTYFELGMVSF